MLSQSSNTEPAPQTGGRLDAFSPLRTPLAILAVAVVAVTLVAPALGGPFLWDDVLLIPNNATVHSLDHWSDWFHSALFGAPGGTAGVARYWRPLALLSFALEWRLAADNPALYHATNLVLYLALVLLVGATLRRYSGNPGAAAVATALFALHPTHAECAAWISGRMDLLVSIGILGACWALGLRIRRGSRAWIWVELAFAAIAYTSKETAAVLPAFCLVEAWMALGAPTRSRAQLGRLTLSVAPQLVLATIYLGLRWLCFPLDGSASARQPTLDLLQRLGVVAETLGRAGALSLIPYPQRAQHGLVSLNEYGKLAFDRAYLVAGCAVVVALFYALIRARRYPPVLFAIALSAIAFLPTANLFSPWLLSCFTFERYLLLPHFGLAWCAAIAFDQLSRITEESVWRRLWPALVVLGLFVAVSFGWRLQQRASDYANAERFWRHELRVNPSSSIAPWSLSQMSAEPVVALEWLRRCHANAARRGQSRDADDCLIAATETLFNALLDSQVDALGRLKLTWMALLHETATPNATPEPIVNGISLSLPRDPTRRGQLLASYPGRVEANLALLHSRLGQHDSAMEWAEASLATCRHCRWAFTLSTVFAAAGQHQRAAEVLRAADVSQPDVARLRQQVNQAAELHALAESAQGPERLRDLAQSMLSIGRFGLALSILEPAEQAIIEAPEAGHAYALIAFRAGRDGLARQVLLHYQQPETVERTLRSWSDERPRLK